MAGYSTMQAVASGGAPEFEAQISWACSEAAIDIENDGGATKEAKKWAQRWRERSIKTPIQTYVEMVLENPTIAATVSGTWSSPVVNATDPDVQFQVNSLVPRFAALP